MRPARSGMLAAMDQDPPPATPDATAGSAFRDGARTMWPLLLGVAPFGMITGVAAAGIGLGLSHAVGFSVIVLAGASQLAAMDLIGRGAPIAVAIGTGLVINLRFLMYSASLAPHVPDWPLRRRAAAAYLLTDQAYALSVTRYARPGGRRHRFAFYLGVATPLWVVWQIATVVGALVGNTVPESVPLGFAVPLTFLAMLRPNITDRPTVVSAVTAALVAIAGADLPANLGMPLAALAGIVAGVVSAEMPARSRR